MDDRNFYQGNLIINKGGIFNQGELKNLKLDEKLRINLENGKIEGSYTSPIISTENFNQLVASWNANTPEKTKIEVLVQVRINEDWSRWFSYGNWSTNKDSGSLRGQSDKFAKLSIDTLDVLNEEYANALRYRVILKREDEDIETASIKSISMALKTEKRDIPVLSGDINYLVELDVPERSQMHIPNIGNRICSPTSVSMVLEYYGYNMETEAVAAGVLDRAIDIYGNWSYNASFAGLEGLSSYVARYNSSDQIKKKISEGIPVVASIRTKSEGTLVGAPQTYPSGHLIVVRGFLEKDGEEYVIVNDPASPEIENITREYKLSDFETAWSNIVYIIIEDKD